MSTADPSVVDYLGIGPVLPTPTKPSRKSPTGFNGLAQLTGMSRVPTVAIGGLRAEHVSAVLLARADGLAVASAICGQADPEHAARALSSALKNLAHRMIGLAQ